MAAPSNSDLESFKKAQQLGVVYVPNPQRASTHPRVPPKLHHPQMNTTRFDLLFDHARHLFSDPQERNLPFFKRSPRYHQWDVTEPQHPADGEESAGVNAMPHSESPEWMTYGDLVKASIGEE
ncbi:MAG: hypothetical protein Q9166_002027 [cf. Caloplaca sp. 2 TL-2023]